MAAGRPVAPQPFGGGEPPDRAELIEAPVRWPQERLSEVALSTLDGIGQKFEQLASEAGVDSVLDLLWRFPGSYREPPGRSQLAELEPGVPSSLVVEVISSRRVRVRRRGLSVVEAVVADDSGRMKAVWFNRHWVLDQLTPGRGLVLEGRLEKKGFVVSDHRALEGHGRDGTGTAGGTGDAPRPRHRAGGEIGPGRWQSWARKACAGAGDIADPLPSRTLVERRMPTAAAAIREAHLPASVERSEEARRRLAYEELFLHQVLLAGLRLEDRQGSRQSVPVDAAPRISSEWLAGLPFELTGDQRAAIEQVGSDLERSRPMRRLLMGEVGSGKTVVALWAMLRAVESGRQAAMMAPTEILVAQHVATLERLLRGTGVRVGVLTGSTAADQRARLLASLETGEPSITVGTHALLEDRVAFSSLAVCVVDEEHRFGVRQRERLDMKAPPDLAANLLHLSATPIPRTLSLTAYGDLDVTAIRELPPGRLPVETRIAGESDRDAVFARVRAEVERGRQAFVVCPLVEESPAVEARAAEAEAERLRTDELAGLEVGLIHGRMSPERRDVAMKAFESGLTDVLVSTTVIEVGIDVPNATTIVIEGAERFGLSQLHQLRGRVGRGAHGGSCVLMSSSTTPAARRRLSALTTESEGFRLAEIDLEMRGEGEVTGTRQHGLPRFRVARLPDDKALLVAARGDLDRLLDREGGLDSPLLSPALGSARRRFDRSGAVR